MATGYNGKVKVGEETVEVKDGIVEVEGETYYVSKKGEAVINKQRQVVGSIKKGVFVPLDDAQIAELQELDILDKQEE
jgi:hypothetical protein